MILLILRCQIYVNVAQGVRIEDFYAYFKYALVPSTCMMFMALLVAARRRRYFSESMGDVAANNSSALYIMLSIATKRDLWVPSAFLTSALRAPRMLLP